MNDNKKEMYFLEAKEDKRAVISISRWLTKTAPDLLLQTAEGSCQPVKDYYWERNLSCLGSGTLWLKETGQNCFSLIRKTLCIKDASSNKEKKCKISLKILLFRELVVQQFSNANKSVSLGVWNKYAFLRWQI